MKTPTHHWRWRSPRYLITCGAKNGFIFAGIPGWKPVTCKNCKRVGESRGWFKESK